MCKNLFVYLCLYPYLYVCPFIFASTHICMFLPAFVCLFVYLCTSICRLVYLWLCPYLYVRLFIFVSTSSCMCLLIYVSTSICMFVSLSFLYPYLYVCLFIFFLYPYLYVCQFIFVSIQYMYPITARLILFSNFNVCYMYVFASLYNASSHTFTRAHTHRQTRTVIHSPPRWEQTSSIFFF